MNRRPKRRPHAAPGKTDLAKANTAPSGGPERTELAKANPKAMTKATPTVGDVLQAIVGEQEKDLITVGIEVADLARDCPEILKRTADRMSRCGMTLTSLARAGNECVKANVRPLLLDRQRIIQELELDTAAEFHLLDMAMDAYLHWQDLTILVRSSFKAGTSDSVGRTQTRLVGMAQTYFQTYLSAMKALQEAKTPPIRVVHVQAGENVAIQINENTRVVEAPHAAQQIEGHGTPSGRSERPERRILSASAPAGPVEAEKAPD